MIYTKHLLIMGKCFLTILSLKKYNKKKINTSIY